MSKTKLVGRAEVVELIIQEKKLGDSAQSSSALSLNFRFKKHKVVRPGVVRPQSYDKSDELKSIYYMCTRHSGDLTDRKSTRLNSSHSGESRMPSSA